jgi:hypothetical protein
MLYGYECDTCPENHWAEFETADEAREFVATWAEVGLKVWMVN